MQVVKGNEKGMGYLVSELYQKEQCKYRRVSTKIYRLHKSFNKIRHKEMLELVDNFDYLYIIRIMPSLYWEQTECIRIER